MVAVANAPKSSPAPSASESKPAESAAAPAATPAPSGNFKLLSVEAAGLNGSSKLAKYDFTPPATTAGAPSTSDLADKFLGGYRTPPAAVPESALVAAREQKEKSLETIAKNPKISPEIKERAKTDPSIRAFLGDEKIPIEMLEKAKTDPQMRQFLYGPSSVVNSSYGPVSQVRVNSVPATVTHTMVDTSVPGHIRTDAAPVHSPGYKAIVDNQKRLLSIDPNKVLEDQQRYRVEHAPDLKFNHALRTGVPTREALATKEQQEREGTSAFRMGKADRKVGDLVGLYDKALHAQATASAIDRGTFKDKQFDGNVEIPLRYESDTQVRASISRSLRFLNAEKDLLAEVKTGDLDRLQSAERRLILDRLSERSGRSQVDILKN